ncbi:hypothetical protein K1719_002042 [Acacia pycnantha]|nr:hypothetical protein K1719_002042 [Acacia pycnantha]
MGQSFHQVRVGCQRSKRPTGNTVSLHSAHQHHLAGPDGKDALFMDHAWITQVVKPTLTENLRSGLQSHDLTEFYTIVGQELREDTSQSSEHSLAGVDDFKAPFMPKFTVPDEGLWVNKEPDCVLAIVTGELTNQVGWRLTREWAQVLDTVWAVPWASRGNRVGHCFRDSSNSNLRGGGPCPANDEEEKAIVEAGIFNNSSKMTQ